ncbi:hypothetical protein TNCV_2111241 [Trichonephila clavipes]|nr:hypothetical protein TNCV_2111241 [Trichonephila clavipes]
MVNSKHCISRITNLFTAALSEEEKTYSYFHQDGAAAHTSHRAMNPIYIIFISDRVLSRGQSDLDLC